MLTRHNNVLFPTLSLTVAAAILMALCDVASARPIRINFEDLFTDFGEDWTDTFNDGVDVTGDGTFGDALAFELAIGSSTYDSYCISENGAIWFAAGGADACATDPGSDPSLDVFTVLGADWVSSYDAVFESAVEDGAVSVSTGFVDRDLDGDGIFDLADGTDAMRFHWNFITRAGFPDEFYSFQIMLFDLGGGDFDVEFNYDGIFNFGVQSIAGPGISSPYVGTSPFTAETDYFFSFRGGQLVTNGAPPPPTPVSEPGTLWLLVFGSGALLFSLRRRRSGLPAAA